MEYQQRSWQKSFATLLIVLSATAVVRPFVESEDPYSFSLAMSLAVLCCLWWGSKAYVALLFAIPLALTLFSLEDPLFYILWAIPHLIQIGFAWVLVRERFKNLQPWVATPQNINLFIVYGGLIPSVAGTCLQETLMMAWGLRTQPDFMYYSLAGIIGDLTAFVFLSLPLLMIVTPFLHGRSLSLFSVDALPTYRWKGVTRKEKILGISLLLGSFALAATMPASEVWYLYGILVLLYAAWYGLYAAVIMNTWIFFLVVALPHLTRLPWAGDSNSLHTPATL